MTDAPTNATPPPDGITVEILTAAAIDEMVGKITAAAAAGTDADVAAWREQHGQERWFEVGHDHAVVGETLMYLHDAPDGVLVPHARYPDGSEKVYTDAEHADEAYPGR